MSLWILRRATLALVALLVLSLALHLPSGITGVLFCLLIGFSAAYGTRRRDYLKARADEYR